MQHLQRPADDSGQGPHSELPARAHRGERERPPVNRLTTGPWGFHHGCVYVRAEHSSSCTILPCLLNNSNLLIMSMGFSLVVPTLECVGDRLVLVTSGPGNLHLE